MSSFKNWLIAVTTVFVTVTIFPTLLDATCKTLTIASPTAFSVAFSANLFTTPFATTVVASSPIFVAPAVIVVLAVSTAVSTTASPKSLSPLNTATKFFAMFIWAPVWSPDFIPATPALPKSLAINSP